jgi:hypothetical protein
MNITLLWYATPCQQLDKYTDGSKFLNTRYVRFSPRAPLKLPLLLSIGMDFDYILFRIWKQLSHLLDRVMTRGAQISGRMAVFCTVLTNICGFSLLDLLCATLQAPRIRSWLLDFSTICRQTSLWTWRRVCLWSELTWFNVNQSTHRPNA